MTADKFDTLINDLAADEERKKCLAHPFIRLIPIIVFLLIYFSAATYFLGMRMDWMEKLTDTYFLFELVLMFFLAISASFCASWMCVPDMRNASWLPTIPMTLFAVFVGWMIVRAITGVDVDHDHHHGHDHHSYCLIDAIVMGFFPAVVLVSFAKCGATTKPIMMCAMNIMTIMAFSYIGLRFTCPSDTITHVTLLHVVPFVLLGFISTKLARRLFRW